MFLISCTNSKLKHIPAPTLNELNVADYGEYPSNYEKIIKDYLHGRLTDPDSIKGLEISEPKPGWTQFHCDYFSDHPKFGYISWVTFNAKNRMGGYVGYKKYLMVIKNGNIIFFRDELGTDRQGVRWGYKL